jgi:hypothetical protein
MGGVYSTHEGNYTNAHYDLNTRVRIILKWILEKQVEVAWTGLICLRTETSGRFLAPQDALSSVELK